MSDGISGSKYKNQVKLKRNARKEDNPKKIPLILSSNEKKCPQDAEMKKIYIFAPSLTKRHEMIVPWCNWQHI